MHTATTGHNHRKEHTAMSQQPIETYRHVPASTVEAVWEQVAESVAYWGAVIETGPGGEWMMVTDCDRCTHVLRREAIAPAILRTLDTYPRTDAAQALRDGASQVDGEAADVVAQVAVFGEIVYG
jgi:hypothetical protein